MLCDPGDVGTAGQMAGRAPAAALDHSPMACKHGPNQPRSAGPRQKGCRVDKFTLQVFPIAQADEWDAWVESAKSGDQAEGHRQMLSRMGITKEHVFRQETPMGPIMVLVWEGVDQSAVGKLLGDILANPQSDHERYLGSHVIPVIHGVDPTAGPPPEMKKVATIEP